MKRLRIKAYTPICKTENGSVGTTARMLKLDDYVKNSNPNKSLQVRLIKGLKGWFRHKYMAYFLKKEIEVCYSSSKENFKDRKVNIPKGFHLLGACEGKCPIYNIFGGVVTIKDKSNDITRPSKIKVWAKPIISKRRFDAQSSKIKAELKKRFNIVMFNIENGIAIGTNDESIQNFGAEFFSGNFEFFVDVTKLNKEELTTLIEVLLTTDIQLGGKKTYGNGIIEIKEILYENIKEEIIISDDGMIKRKEVVEQLELPKVSNLILE